MEPMGQCVMTSGIILIPQSSADSWDSPPMVSQSLVSFSFPSSFSVCLLLVHGIGWVTTCALGLC